MRISDWSSDVCSSDLGRMNESFLSRWSRRKEEARRVGQGSEPQSDGAAEPASDAQSPATGVEGPAVEPELTAEEIARLPKIDELTADRKSTRLHSSH